MKILAICNESPFPVNNGQRTRSASILNSLCMDHEVDLFVIHYQNEDLGSQFIRKYGFNKNFKNSLIATFQAIRSHISLYQSRFSHLDVKKYLDHLLSTNSYDAVLCEGLPTMACLPENIAIPIWLDEHNIEYEIYKRYHQIEKNPIKKWLFKRETALLKKWEEEQWQRTNWISCCSEIDQRAILAKTQPCSIIPNSSFIDSLELEILPFEERQLNIVLSASLGWKPNVEGALWFYNNVWPLLKKSIPKLTWTLAGRNPAPEILALAKEDGIEVTGAVPSMSPYLNKARVAIVPLFTGSGTRIKILEAAQHGLPVVSTLKGAEGLEFCPNSEIGITDDPNTQANYIRHLLSNQQYWNAMSQKSLQRFNKSYSFKRIKKDVDFVSYNLLEGISLPLKESA